MAADSSFLERKEHLEFIKNNSLPSNLILKSESGRAQNTCAKQKCVLEVSNTGRLMQIYF